MTSGPVQSFLLLLCVSLAAALSLALFIRPGWKGVRGYVIGGVFLSIGVDALGVLASSNERGVVLTGLFVVFELLGALAWLMFSRRYARRSDSVQTETLSWPTVVAVSIALGGLLGVSVVYPSVFVSPASPQVVGGFVLSTVGFALRTVSLGIMIMCLTSLEATLVNAVHGQRWRIKYAILGAFAILAAHIFTLSLGLLYRAIDFSLAPARQIGFCVGMALMLYSVVYRGGESPVTVSKRLARTSLVLFGAGAYLLFLGGLGLSMTLTGGASSKALLLALGLVGGVGILGLLLSDSFRRRFTRVLQRYFYKEKYDYRVQWLVFTKRLANARTREDLHQAVLLGFCETFGMGGAVLYLKESENSPLVPVSKWEVHQEPPRLGIAQVFAQNEAEASCAIDLRQGLENVDDDVALFLNESKAMFAVPLMKEDRLDGVVLLVQPMDEKEDFSQEDYDLMQALATQACSALLNLRLADLLSQARDMEVMGKVSTFIVHDLKNLIYTLTLMTENAKRYIQEPEFQRDMLKSLENTVAKMHMLISQLRQLPTRENLHLETADIGHLVEDTCKHLPMEGLRIVCPSVVAVVDKAQIHKVILNLVLNAREASAAGGFITIETGEDTTPYFRITDNGAGMTSQFITENLFKPFKTTKAKGMGIGLYQCKQIVEAHGGTIEVVSTPGEGSVFTVRLPAPASLDGKEAA